MKNVHTKWSLVKNFIGERNVGHLYLKVSFGRLYDKTRFVLEVTYIGFNETLEERISSCLSVPFRLR